MIRKDNRRIKENNRKIIKKLTRNIEEEELKEIFEDSLSKEKWEKFEDWLAKVGQKKIINKIIEQAYNKEQYIWETITEVV